MTPSALSTGLVLGPMLGLVLGLLLSGCAVQPLPPVAQARVPQAFAEPVPAATAGAEALHDRWWTAFADPALDRLIARAERDNLGLQQALERVRSARAILAGTQAASRPQLTAELGASRQGGALVNAAGTQGSFFNLGATLSYEWDLLGRNQLQQQAALLDVRAREALAASSRLLVQGQVAQLYWSWCALADERQILQQQQEALLDSLALAERLERAGLAASRDLTRWRAELAATRLEAVELERRQRESAHALATLLGLAPAELTLPARAAASPTVPIVPAGLPSDLLTRRADIAAAYFSAQAAARQLGIQQQPWWPVLRLTTNGGLASLELAQWLSGASRAWGLASAISAAVLDGGEAKAQREQARSQLASLHLAYREQVLVALREVDDQLSSLRALSEQQAIAAQSLHAARDARALVEGSRSRGLASGLDVLEARRAELRARRTASQLEWARAQATVGLVRALGGGWAGERPHAGPVDSGHAWPAANRQADLASSRQSSMAARSARLPSEP